MSKLGSSPNSSPAKVGKQETATHIEEVFRNKGTLNESLYCRTLANRPPNADRIRGIVR